MDRDLMTSKARQVDKFCYKRVYYIEADVLTAARLPSLCYSVTRDAIDGQGEKDVDRLLERFIEKESLLKTDKKALTV
jgi:hypothetical protein